MAKLNDAEKKARAKEVTTLLKTAEKELATLQKQHSKDYKTEEVARTRAIKELEKRDEAAANARRKAIDAQAKTVTKLKAELEKLSA